MMNECKSLYCMYSAMNRVYDSMLLQSLHYRQCDAIDLLIDVEGVDIRHAADIVHDCHQPRFEVIAMDVVLAAEPLDELLAMKFLGMHGSVDKCLHQRFHDLVTTQFHVEHGFALVDLGIGRLDTTLIGLAQRLAHVADEAALELAVEYLLLVLHKGVHAFVLQQSHHAGAHIHDLLVAVCHILVFQPLQDVVAPVLVKESEQEVRGFRKGQNLQFVRVLNVHDLIADVVGRLHQVDEWVAAVA